MRWDAAVWRTLYARVDASWVALDVSARGLALELLRYADDTGFIKLGLKPQASQRDVADEIARVVQARSRERARIRRDVEQLLAPAPRRPPFLVMVEGGVQISHATPVESESQDQIRKERALAFAAARQARFRARKRAQNGAFVAQEEPS